MFPPVETIPSSGLYLFDEPYQLRLLQPGAELLPGDSLPEEQSRLLVVDDDEANRTTLSRRLINRGYSVDTAEGGAQALDMILGELYDLILLDQMMPGMNGLDLLRLLRATYSPSRLPVIMVTALDENEAIVRALDQGANDYVVKPVEMPEIVARIKAQLSRSRVAQAEPAAKGSADAGGLGALAGALAAGAPAVGAPATGSLKDVKHPRSASRKNSGSPTGSAGATPPSGSWSWEPATNRAIFSPSWKQVLGLASSEVGETLDEWLDRIHPDDLFHLRKDLNAFLRGTQPEFRSEHRVRCGDQTYRWMLCRAVGHQAHDGRLSRLVGSLADIEDRKAQDPLTGLGNREQMLDRLATSIAATSPFDTPVSVLLLDLDGFKAINDAMGHQVGDRLLLEVAVRVRTCLSNSTANQPVTIARAGGDEFGIVARCTAPDCDPSVLADAMLASLKAPVLADGRWIKMSASIGIATADRDNSRPDQVLRDAELAMRKAKEMGKNRWCQFTPELRQQALTRRAIANDLRYAVERGELVAVYQPKLNLRDRTIAGFEALLRWRHPQLGMLPPIEFIPVAEETGLIISAGAWILREACQQLKRWQDLYPQDPPLKMSVNLSVKQLADPNLVPVVASVLEETGLQPSSLILELTESSLLAEREMARNVLSEIRDMSVGLELDDFGTGYSSLSYLNLLRFDALKIDRSFVSRLESDTECRAIIRTIVGLARELRMGVVAEGIETQPQLERLLEMGCELGQGYLFARPAEAEVIDELLSRLAQHSHDVECGETTSESTRALRKLLTPDTEPASSLV